MDTVLTLTYTEERNRKKGEKTYLHYVLGFLHLLFHLTFIIALEGSYYFAHLQMANKLSYITCLRSHS